MTPATSASGSISEPPATNGSLHTPPMSRPDPVAALAAERVAELRRQIDYLASTAALLPASPRRAAARAAVQAIDRDIAELFRHLGVDDPRTRPPS
jgi:hypothetical protein